MSTDQGRAFDELITAGRRITEAGLSPGSSGNLSVRSADRIYTTGTGTVLGRLEPSDIAVLDPTGRPLGGIKPSKEVALHVAFYAKNPDHGAVVHVHSPFAVAASCLEPWSAASAVPPITPYFLMRVGQTPLIPFRLPGDPELGDLLLADPHPFQAALLANHGQITSGADLERAAEAAIELEEACRITILTDGKQRRLLEPTDCAELATRSGTPWTSTPATRACC